MVEAKNLRKAPTKKSGLGLLALAVLIVAVVIAAAWILSLPGVMDKVLYIALVAVAAIAIVCIGAYALLALAAVPYYMAKGEQYQENVDYSLNDVDPVEGKTLEDRKE